NLSSTLGNSPTAVIDPSNYQYSSQDSLTINRGKDFPLKSVTLGEQAALPITPHVKNVILDAKVFGAVMGMYYRIIFIANGVVVKDKPRYGMTVEERRISDG